MFLIDGSRRGQVNRSCSIPGAEYATRLSLDFGRIMCAGLKLVCSGQESVIAADYVQGSLTGP